MPSAIWLSGEWPRGWAHTAADHRRARASSKNLFYCHGCGRGGDLILAVRLARDGDPEPFHLEETDTGFAIEWKGHYRIEGSAFVYADRDTGRVTAILGYPTQKIAQAG